VSKRKRALKASFRKHYYFKENLWRVNAGRSGLYVGMLKPMLEQLFAMLAHHNKLLVIRFDCHQDHATENSDHISRFMDKLKKRLMRKYKLCRAGYVWAREQEKVKHQHYHFVLMIDGNKAQHSFEILKIAKQIWQDQNIGNTFSIAPNPFYHFKRNDIASVKDVIWCISYLAKGRGKGYRSPQAKDYASSRIKAPNTDT
jgi:REP element-mobilizing transposase RayT